MLIEDNTVVSFHYRLSEPGQKIAEDSRTGDPVVYLHGHHQMLPGLESALVGKQAGETFTITLAPEQAYGLRRENAMQRVSIKQVLSAKKNQKYKAGMTVQIQTQNGPREMVVVKAGLTTLDVDTNHPLAGKTLVFEMEVLEVRQATPEEKTHGHAHGAGGHQHS